MLFPGKRLVGGSRLPPCDTEAANEGRLKGRRKGNKNWGMATKTVLARQGSKIIPDLPEGRRRLIAVEGSRVTVRLDRPRFEEHGKDWILYHWMAKFPGGK